MADKNIIIPEPTDANARLSIALHRTPEGPRAVLVYDPPGVGASNYVHAVDLTNAGGVLTDADRADLARIRGKLLAAAKAAWGF